MPTPGVQPPTGDALPADHTGPAPTSLVDPSTRRELDDLSGVLAAQGLGVRSIDGRGERAGGPPTAGQGGSAAGLHALGWAASGLMWLTGMPGRAPLVPDGPVLDRARAAAWLFTSLSARLGCRVDLDVARLLGGRAALMGLRRAGVSSANGSCRLLRAADTWIAVSLARPHDVDALDALLGALGDQAGPAMARPRLADTAWTDLARGVSGAAASDVIQIARLLAMPASVLRTDRRPVPFRSLPVADARPARRTAPHRAAPRRDERGAPDRRPLVVDLSAMWAGPLCAHLLGRAGLRVVKVESSSRPDGARGGDPAFYDWLHRGHESVELDFAAPRGRTLLRRLVDRADVVIESSRPRALAQLGLDARGLVAARPGKVWISITGYGRTFGAEDQTPDPVAFGDDAAVAGGLVAWERTDHATSPVFCADAIADPLTGLFAAVAAAGSLLAGGGHLLDIPLRDVAAWVAAPAGTDDRDRHGRALPWRVTGSDQAGWTVHHGSVSQRVLPPRTPRSDSTVAPPARAAPAGAHTQIVLERMGLI
ncbi:CoA transferase [Frankia sp. AgKG'84/4]|uniref:CoA transferase n=1 Tax=Frankia sp. AgKG'84/4 TaxID=573490 RepID=UPI00200DF4C5|nr:CoA transferase [Frankia sp. AgKG'84/4]MCL9792857.1 CoA transferase [Frankia sp. AgKG'84/4]